MSHPHPNPLRPEGLLGRVAPFAAVTVLASVFALLVVEDADALLVSIAALSTMVIVTSPWYVPWERLPYWAQAIPPVSYFVVVGILREASGGEASPFGVMAVLPVVWLALYGTRNELKVGLIGVAATFMVPYLVLGEPSYSGDEIARAVLWLGVSLIVGLTTQTLVSQVRDQAAVAQRQASAVRVSEERLRQILDTAHEAFIAMDSDGRITAWNPEAERALGWPREEAVGRDLAGTIIPPPFRERHREGLDRFLKTGEGPVFDRRLELTALHRHGHELPVELTISPLETDEGFVFNAFLRDISTRKQLERYSGAQHAVAELLAQAGASARVMPAVLEALARSLGFELGAYWRVDDADKWLRCVDVWHDPALEIGEFDSISRELTFQRGVGLPGRVWQQGEPVQIENVLTDAQFTRGQAATGHGLQAAIGLPILSGPRTVGVMEFLSREATQLDRELLEMLGAIGRQLGDFIERRRAEREAERLKTEFFSLVSHEFRSPLTSIVGYVDLLLDESDGAIPDEQRTQFLSVVKRNSERLRRLVDDLLFISKVQAGKFTLNRRIVDLRQIAEQALEAARPVADRGKLELTLEADQLRPVYGDPDRLSQLFDNLLSNAVKYTPENESVTVRLFTEAGQVVAEITNSGAYIPPDDLERLFERFYRRSSDAGSAPGAGLGLAIVESIVDAHGGRIEVESDPNIGTSFSVQLPFRSPSKELDPQDAKEVAA